MKRICNLFLTFLKIGTFTFGGGYAMIALIENEFVDKKKILSKDDFLNMVTISESTPGPIAINSATYIGYTVGGFFGALFSTIAVCIPSFLIIIIISLFFNDFLNLKYVAFAFKGIQVCVIYLILSAGLKMLKGLNKSIFNYIIFFSVASLMIIFSIFSISFSSIFYILICGLLGFITFEIKNIKERKKENKK